MTKKATARPTPAKIDSRICFGIAYYLTEADANRAAEDIARRHETYNGGFYHGMPCGRDAAWDYTDEALGRLYAVTTR